MSYNKSKEILPIGIRGIIYSFFSLDLLISKVQGISVKDQEILTSDIMDQPRCLRISFSPKVFINYAQLKRCLKIATSFEIYIERMQDVEMLPFQMVSHKIEKLNQKLEKSNQKPKLVKSLVIGLGYLIDVRTLREAILQENEKYFKDVTIKIISPPSSELIPKIFQTLGSFMERLEIDLNQKTIDFYEFPSSSVQHIKYLSFKKHGYEFEKLVELFLNVQHLRVQAEEFKNVKSNLFRQKDLRTCEICCYYPKIDNKQLIKLIRQQLEESENDPQKLNNLMQVKNTVHIYEIFNLKFYDPKKVDLIFRFKNCQLELSNILLRFGSLKCKSVTLWLDELTFTFQEPETKKKEGKDMYIDSDEEMPPRAMSKQPRNKLQKFIENITVVDFEKNSHDFYLSEFQKTNKGFTMQYFKVLEQEMVNPVRIISKEFQVKF